MVEDPCIQHLQVQRECRCGKLETTQQRCDSSSSSGSLFVSNNLNPAVNMNLEPDRTVNYNSQILCGKCLNICVKHMLL